jgi:hypothetical protein
MNHKICFLLKRIVNVDVICKYIHICAKKDNQSFQFIEAVITKK